MINPAPGFWPIFGPLGPAAGPGSPRNGPGSKNSAGCTKHQPRRPILSPIRCPGPMGKTLASLAERQVELRAGGARPSEPCRIF